MRNLANFSETRFANSKRKVFKNCFLMLGPIVSCLEEQVLAAERNRSQLEAANSRIREKGDKARQLRGKLFNKKFVLLLAGVSDIYEMFGVAVQITQDYRLLPHQRLFQLKNVFGIIDGMSQCVSHSQCVKPLGRCNFKLFHGAVDSLITDGTVQDIVILDTNPEEAAGTQIMTRCRNQSQQNLELEGFLVEVEAKVSSLAKELANALKSRVVDEEEESIIHNTEIILDVPNLAILIKNCSTDLNLLCLSEFPRFRDAIIALRLTSLTPFEEDDIKNHFKTYLAKLKHMTSNLSVEELEDMDPRVLLKELFDPKTNFFEDTQLVLQAMACASVKVSCESILESFTSKFENHFDLRRNVDEESSSQEFEISQNGPSYANCDGVVKEAMRNYWMENGKNGAWHFTRTSADRFLKKLDHGSVVLDRLFKQSSSLPSMDA